jgi:hypothetical protein
MDKEVKKKKVGMGKGMCWKGVVALVKTIFANKVIMFEEVLEFKKAIFWC